MSRDTRTRRDLHALDENGMVLCNPRDREAAHRAETEGIATHDTAAVTCAACRELLHRRDRDRRTAVTPAPETPPTEAPGAAAAAPFVRIRDAAKLVGRVREGDGVDPRLERPTGRTVGGRRKPDHGADRLAGQILDALRFSTALSEAGLDDFMFAGVLPGAHGGHFIVEVACLDPQAVYDPADVERILSIRRAKVRAEVSESVHRRKAPDLSFRVKPPGSPPG